MTSNRFFKGNTTPPSLPAITDFVNEIRAMIFPGLFERKNLDIKYILGQQIEIAYKCVNKDVPCIKDIVKEFKHFLPELHEMMEKDVIATYEGDPAAQDYCEVVCCYPAIKAIINYRIAHKLHQLGVPLLPRMITELAHSETGIDIHPGATIGGYFTIDHGTGVVIGETCIVGERVKLYQGVTLGAKSFPLDENGNPIKGIPRHPIIGNNVVIYSNATILGRITIGDNATIGGNVWLTHDVQKGETILKD